MYTEVLNRVGEVYSTQESYDIMLIVMVFGYIIQIVNSTWLLW